MTANMRDDAMEIVSLLALLSFSWEVYICLCC